MLKTERGGWEGEGRRRNLTEDLRHARFIRCLPSGLLTPPQPTERRCNHPSWYRRHPEAAAPPPRRETLIFDGRVVSLDRGGRARGRDAIDRGKVKNTRIERKGKKEIRGKEGSRSIDSYDGCFVYIYVCMCVRACVCVLRVDRFPDRYWGWILKRTEIETVANIYLFIYFVTIENCTNETLVNRS